MGVYSSYLGLVPNYNVGFVILAAGDSSAPDLNAFADLVGDYLVPELEKTAIAMAQHVYAGTYVSDTASSITIDVSGVLPGMSITKWSNNGVDMMSAIAKLNNIKPGELSARLYPMNLGDGRTAFRAVFQDEGAFADSGTPTCISWMDVDQLVYGGVALDLFIFQRDGEGMATGVNIPGLRTTLKKE